MKAKSDEENKGGGAADARRWNGLRNVVESRALLKTAFRTASTLKAQVQAVKLNSVHCLCRNARPHCQAVLFATPLKMYRFVSVAHCVAICCNTGHDYASTRSKQARPGHREDPV